jgi:IPT/TIG domain
MSQTDVGNADRKAGTERCTRPTIFWYDVGVIVLLGVIAIGYFEFRQQVDDFVAKPVAALALRAMWFAALGGIVISLKGVYDHACMAGGWDDGFSLWHFGRPLSGAIAGLVTVVLLSAINPSGDPSEPVVYAVAFIFGTQEKRFFNFLYEVAKLVVQVPGEQAESGLQVVDVQPQEGKSGTVLMIKGRGFQPGVTVKIGTAGLEMVTVTKDGTGLAGLVPVGPAGAADVTVTNPGGASIVLSGGFKYLQ